MENSKGAQLISTIVLLSSRASAAARGGERRFHAEGVPGSLVTSRLTRLECRSKPLRAGDLATLAQFDVFFAGVELVLAEFRSFGSCVIGCKSAGLQANTWIHIKTSYRTYAVA